MSDTSVETPADLTAMLQALTAEGVRLWVEGDELRYRAPRGALTDDHKAILKSSKQQVVALVQRQTAARRPPPETPNCEAVWWPTDGQAGLLRDSHARNLDSTYNWEGPLEIGRFAAALCALVERHSILRTHYCHGQEGEIWAVTEASARVPLHVVDLSAIDPSLQQRQVDLIRVDALQRKFDTTRAPLVRAAVLRLSAAQYMIIFVLHHSVFDASSHIVLQTDLLKLYESGAGALPPLTMQYRDFAGEQREWLNGEPAERHLDYWRRKLRSAERIFWLPPDRHTPVADSSELPWIRDELDPQTLAGLRSLAKSDRTTLFSIACTAFAVIIASWSESPDVSMWICHHGRIRSEHLKLIGCFADHWPLRLDLAGNLSFRAALKVVHAGYLDALPHLGITVPKLRPILNHARKGKFYPSIIFNYLASATDAPALAGACGAITHDTAVRKDPPRGRLGENSAVSIHLTVHDLGDTMMWLIKHAAHLFEEATIEQVSRTYKSLLTAVAHSPDMPIASLVRERIAAACVQPPQ